MTETKAKALAEVLGGEVEWTMPQSRMAGVRLALPDGRLAMIDEHGGETFNSPADMNAYFADGDDTAHIAATREWTDWGITESWAAGLATLIGGEAHQSGGNIWVVLSNRPDGKLALIGDDGAEVYRCRDHYERYYEGGQPEPQHLSWD
jgi:hypothetical protein